MEIKIMGRRGGGESADFGNIANQNRGRVGIEQQVTEITEEAGQRMEDWSGVSSGES
jgi:hypothetical protein